MGVSADHGTLAIGQSGVRHLGTRSIEGDDPLAPYGHHAAAALKRLDSMDNCGDIALISTFDPNTGQVAAFEELIGSHGGLGGPQTGPFLLYPTDWTLVREQPIGAPQVNEQLQRWLDDLRDAKPTMSPSLSDVLADKPPDTTAVA